MVNFLKTKDPIAFLKAGLADTEKGFIVSKNRCLRHNGFFREQLKKFPGGVRC